MKKAIAVFIVLFGIVVLSVIRKSSQANIVTETHQAQQVQTAQQTRSHDLQLLKRPAVRSACIEHPDWAMEDCQTMDERQVSVGMTAEQVKLAWGKPDRVNATMTAAADREQWVYGKQYLYMKNGVLRSMQSPR